MKINTGLNSNETHQFIQSELQTHGAVLLRDYQVNLEGFSGLVSQLCSKVSIDPARFSSTDSTQQVDAGTAAVGLHIENANTPSPPDIVMFYSQKSAKSGSQTTWCDGVRLYDSLPDRLKSQFDQDIVMSRTIPREHWQRYVAKSLGKPDAARIDRSDLFQLIAALPGQAASFDEADNCLYQLTLSPLLPHEASGKLAFANALLGPSFNYEAPDYRYQDGMPVNRTDLDEVAEIAESITEELAWQDGDILVLDNRRVMHGRRAIDVPLAERKLFIGMGHL